MKKNTVTTINERTEEVKSQFAELLRNYEHQARTRSVQNEEEYSKALTELATACTYSVLKKLCNVGGAVLKDSDKVSDTAKTVRALRQSVAKDTSDLNRIRYAMDNAITTEYNADGELQTVVKDQELNDALTTLCSQTLGDGLDLVNTAVMQILIETVKVKDITSDFMEEPYNDRRMDTRVRVQREDSKGGFKTVETTPIQEVFRAIRREIEKNRSIPVASFKYTYLEEMLKDTESDKEESVFYRLAKYSGLAGEVRDFNGKITSITADMTTADEVKNHIEEMDLTTTQKEILNLRLSGYGYKAIAKYRGITPRAVKDTMSQIQKKARKIGLKPHIIERLSEEQIEERLTEK